MLDKRIDAICVKNVRSNQVTTTVRIKFVTSLICRLNGAIGCRSRSVRFALLLLEDPEKICAAHAQSMVIFPLPTSYMAARMASFFCFTRSPRTGEVSRNTDACRLAFCRLAVVRSPLAPAIAGWMY